MTTLLHDGLILDHASGAAPAALSVLALAQAELRPDAARRIVVAETAMASLLETAPPAKLDPDRYARLLAAMDAAGQPVQQCENREANGDEVYPAALRGLIPDRDSQLKWSRRPGGRAHIRLENLCAPGIEAELIRLDPGRTIPAHDHEGEEYTLVLSGGFSDMRGHYARGDVCSAEPGMLHRPRVDPDEPCLCFAVSLGRMKFTNPLIAAYDRLVSRHD